MTSGKSSPADSTPKFDWLHDQLNEGDAAGPDPTENTESNEAAHKADDPAPSTPPPAEPEPLGTDSVFSASSSQDDERSASALDDDDDIAPDAAKDADIGSQQTHVMEQRPQPPAESQDAPLNETAASPEESGSDGPDFSNWGANDAPAEAAEFHFDAAPDVTQPTKEETSAQEAEQPPAAEAPQPETEAEEPATPTSEPQAAADGPDFSNWGASPEPGETAASEPESAPTPPPAVDEQAPQEPEQAASTDTAAVDEATTPEVPADTEANATETSKSETAAPTGDGPDFSNWGATAAAGDDVPAFTPQEEAPAPLFDPNAAPAAASSQQPDQPATETTGESATNESTEVKSEPAAAAATTTAKAPAASQAKPASGDGEGRSQLMWLVLISYASAITLALLFLLFRDATSKPQPHQLESLPDVAPLKEGQFLHYPVEAPLPPGHVLPLGEKQRLGNIEIEPLRVTKEPVEFVHYTGDRKKQKPASGEVLKLWLRLTNVSQDQQIAPLDAELLFTRKLASDGRLVANNFVYRREDKDENGPFVFVFDHPLTSDWDLAGQQLGHVLEPGESVEVYIPSDEAGLAQLSGECLWRIHFRKGFSPAGNGVTTLVDVAFSTDEVTAPGA